MQDNPGRAKKDRKTIAEISVPWKSQKTTRVILGPSAGGQDRAKIFFVSNFIHFSLNTSVRSLSARFFLRGACERANGPLIVWSEATGSAVSKCLKWGGSFQLGAQLGAAHENSF
jgi:hypothetical protein